MTALQSRLLMQAMLDAAQAVQTDKDLRDERSDYAGEAAQVFASIEAAERFAYEFNKLEDKNG